MRKMIEVLDVRKGKLRDLETCKTALKKKKEVKAGMPKTAD